RRSLTRRMCPRVTQSASALRTPRVTEMPAARKRSRPRPATLGSGSSIPTTTRAMPASTRASAQGGVPPWCEQGSNVTYMVAPRARAPARRSASVSACGRPPGCVQPRAITSPVVSSTITAPTAGFGAVVPSPRRASIRAMSMKRASRADRQSLDVVRAMRFLAGAILLRDLGQHLVEIRDFAEITVNGRKSYIGNRVQPAQGLAHNLTDRGGGYLRFPRALELPYDAGHHAFDPL